MSELHTNRESPNLPGWTLVNSQGEILSGDEDSESSESSIEVVCLEGTDIVSHRMQGGGNSEQVEVVVAEAAPSTDSTSEEIGSSLENLADIETASIISASNEGTQNSVYLQDTTLDSSVIHDINPDINFPDHVQSNLTFSQSLNSQDRISISADEFQEQGGNLLQDDITFQCSSAPHFSVSCEMSVQSGDINSGQASTDEAGDGTFQADSNITMEHFNMNATTDEPHIADDLRLEESLRELTDRVEGACCKELLFEGGDAQEADVLSATGAKEQQFPIPTPVTFEETSISQVLSEEVTENRDSIKNDSDADSDFVRLDSDNIDAYGGEHQNNGDRVGIPLRLYRTGSSIGPGFSFMRSNERIDQIPPTEDSSDVVDQDRDDDTESSTEEGIDDRIESEQSETGSLSAQNDVGDLSVFADIGDLPLIAGDVPRNYIHRPNNHLSTVLNIIVVLVAILTMGISLGIIMATDLEIEEWQNAHEFQTGRVNQLEILLKDKTKAYEIQLSRVKELEPQLTEMRSINRGLEKRTKIYERALDAIAAYSSVEGETFDKSLHAILGGIKDYVQCQEESTQLVAGDCHLKLLPYVKSYTALIRNDASLHKEIDVDLDVLLGKTEFNDKDMDISLGIATANAPISLISDDDSVVHVIREAPKIAREADFRNDGLDLGTDNYDEVSLQERSVFLPPSPVSDGYKDEKPGLSSEHSETKTKETIQASPVPLDIRQLQLSLSREQERALHWQQLYVSERRQKERERENEEWEDERERELAEKEREQMDQVECLRKLMSANLTTLSQHVVKWNVSVFDDFANLSMLLSGIADLQQAVIDSVQSVWKSAEVVIDSFQGKDSIREEKTWEDTVPKKEMIIEYLGKLAARVKNLGVSDHEALVEYLGRMLDHVKLGVEDILNEVYTQSVTDSASKMWENAEEIIKGFQSHEERVVDGEHTSSTMPVREYLFEYLSKMLNDICNKDNTLFEVPSAKLDNEDEVLSPEIFHPYEHRASEYMYKDFRDISPAGPDLETPSHGINPEEEKTTKHGFWSRRIGKILKKTGKTVRKLGRKVAGTWDKIKTMWREKKPFWHKIKNMWHVKKSGFFNTGDRFASTVIKATSKFGKMCTKMSRNWFETTEVDINSKCVKKVRKSWQKMLVKDPCQYVGKFSYECNSDRKQRKSNLKKMSDSFSHLLRIPKFRHEEILKLKTNDLKAYLTQFNSFQDQWRKSKLLLKSDLKWVDCKLAWWSAAVTSSKRGIVEGLEDDNCNIINLADNFYEGHHGIIFGPDVKCVAEILKKNVNYDEGENTILQADVNNYQRNCFLSLQDDDDDDNYDHDGTEKENDHKNTDDHENNLSNDETERNETATKEQAAKWEQGRRKQFPVKGEGYSEIYDSQWIFEKAKDREHQREESSKSLWLFERANHRRDNFHRKWDEDLEKMAKNSEHRYHKKGERKSGNWFLKQAEERQKVRTDEHKSDWLFERAADRRKSHYDKHNSYFWKHGPNKLEHGKQFRHTYGKVSTP